MSTLVSVQDLRVSFRLGKHQVVEAVRGVSFEVPENGAVALLGPNGAGKTSLIRAISGLLDVHHGAVREGDITLAGRSIRGLRADKIVSAGVAQGLVMTSFLLGRGSVGLPG